MTPAVGLVVLARFDSARLPGKVLADIGGRPMLDHVVGRARKVDDVRGVVVATSARAVDDPIEAWAAAAGVDVHRGPADDVLGRCIEVATRFGFDALVRISADSPFVDPVLIAAVLRHFVAGEVDLATNVFPRSFPPGTSVEVASSELLHRVHGLTADAQDREHVTRWCYAHPEQVRLANVAAPDDRYREIDLAVDEPLDLERARWITARLDDPAGATLDEVVTLAREFDARPA